MFRRLFGAGGRTPPPPPPKPSSTRANHPPRPFGDGKSQNALPPGSLAAVNRESPTPAIQRGQIMNRPPPTFEIAPPVGHFAIAQIAPTHQPSKAPPPPVAHQHAKPQPPTFGNFENHPFARTFGDLEQPPTFGNFENHPFARTFGNFENHPFARTFGDLEQPPTSGEGEIATPGGPQPVKSPTQASSGDLPPAPLPRPMKDNQRLQKKNLSEIL
ncbi:hypothetical protein TIFTF001_009837 [Ficus carica]|uniref:Uncharacterized protein n=1 Tax=Ficus carica TaxID=3494 RepID=A0AA87ZVS2_FICCA|nr:hypothetical protein TIFTF001_009837 [Ficus carica]